jgi:hypothetical protein
LTSGAALVRYLSQMKTRLVNYLERFKPDQDPRIKSETRFERALDWTPIWGLRLLSFLNLLRKREWLAVGAHLTRTEWTEGPDKKGHCCTQNQCWAHVSQAWCRCKCLWCRVARFRGDETPYPTKASA